LPNESFKHASITALFLFTLYIVLSNIALGQMTFDIHPIVAYLALVIALLLLFNVEGLEIAVTALYGVTLDKRMRKQFHTTAVIHDLTSDPLILKNFLIGRQVFVIVLVFVLAGLTSSDQRFLPFTEIRLPDLLALVIFKVGLLGALMTFWLGQISGKIMASQAPVRFLNFPVQIILVKFAILVANSGLAYPIEKLVHARVSLSTVSHVPAYCDFSPTRRPTMKKDMHGIFD
jgi:hypothetical protein